MASSLRRRPVGVFSMRTQEGEILLDVHTKGMHCRACELLVEDSVGNIPGVKHVQANADRNRLRVVCDAQQVPTPHAIAEAIKPHGYSVVTGTVESSDATSAKKISWQQLAVAFGIVLLLGFFLDRLGVFSFSTRALEVTTFGPIFLIGLVAASSSCLAVSGGLMLSIVANLRQAYPQLPGRVRFLAVGGFVLGRVLGYTVFGALIGLLGKALQPTPLATGVLTILAALFMLVMGLDMLHVAPVWLKRVMPRMPKVLTRKIVAGNKTATWFTPALFGALTFFLPCGFTQALQVYVLSTGDALTGATVMLAFALGTAPALLAVGWATNVLQGRAGQFFFRVAGAAVIVLGLYNISNGFTITGHPLPTLLGLQRSGVSSNLANVTVQDGVQVVKTSFTESGYAPASFTVAVGTPVRWEIDGSDFAGGCRSVFQVPAFSIQKFVEAGVNVVEFTPDKPGKYSFSCGMGMYPGSFNVIQT